MTSPAVLNEHPSFDKASQRTVILLNSRFSASQNHVDLESCVSDARQRHDLLHSKLASSRLKINALLAGARVLTDTHLHTASELSLLRHSLTDELSELVPQLISTVSNDEGNATLLEDTETLHRSLKELQSIKGYVQVIEHALRLSESSIEHSRYLKSALTEASLSDYWALHEFVHNVSELCSALADASDEQSLHLFQFLEESCENTWRNIQDIFSKSLADAAERIGWPMPIDYPSCSTADRSSFEQAFRNLLKLQKLGDTIRPSNLGRNKGLYALQALIRPVSLRFKYHFDGKRQTNRIDKPEWYFTHILNIAHDHRAFMATVVQRLLASSDYAGLDAWLEFTTLLLSIPSRKLKQTIPSLLPHPPLLAHTIYQTLLFDVALAEQGFRSQKTVVMGPEAEWRGASDIILGNPEWFDAWLFGEQKFAEDQYHDIISGTDAWFIEGHDEDAGSKELKSTNSARRVCSLIEQVTDRYSPLPDSTQRIRFLNSVQLPVLDQYHTRIVSSLDAFETLSSVFIRSVPGALGVGREEVGIHVDTERLTRGVGGIQRLCKALLSAKYIEASLRKWGEEPFFVELWTAIHQNLDLVDHTVANSSLLPGPKPHKEDVPIGTLFDALISRYGDLVNRAEDMIVHQVCGEVESGLKVHFVVDPPLDQNSGQTNDIALPQSLLAPISLLSSNLTFLGTILSHAMLTALYRRIASRLADHIFQRQIMHRGRFTLQEGKRLHAEYQLWVQSCHASLYGALGGPRSRVETPWRRLSQAGSLVSADRDVWTAISEATFGMKSDDHWEHVISKLLGSFELKREDVAEILRRRKDCDW